MLIFCEHGFRHSQTNKVQPDSRNFSIICLEMTDVFTGESIGIKKEFVRIDLEAHDCAMYICRLAK